MKPSELSRTKRIGFAVAAVLLPLMLIEGGSSLVLLGGNLSRSLSLSGSGPDWTTFEPTVGRVPKPNVRIPNAWPGVELRTNAQGFRNDEDFGPQVPAGKLRVMCSGDSYTMGQGASSADTWCNSLATFDPRLEAANLGMSGFGFDNAYLRYRHHAQDLEHDVHVFAFITDDLYRMIGPWLWSWQRPLLEVQDGQLSLPETIPCIPCKHRWLLPVVIQVGQTRTVSLLGSVGRRLGLGERVNVDAAVEEIATHVIDDLARIAAERNATLILVHLPTVWEQSDERSQVTRRWLKRVTASRDVPYVDLIADFEQLPSVEAADFFLPTSVDRGRHYTAAGHRWVAERVHEAIRAQLP